MKYAYADLGAQEQGNEVVIKVRGGAHGVMLIDVANFLRYRTGRSFRFTGGRYRGSPARLGVVGAGQHDGAGIVGRAGWSPAQHASQKGRTDGARGDELERNAGREDGQRDGKPAEEVEQPATGGRDRLRQRALGPNGVGTED